MRLIDARAGYATVRSALRVQSKRLKSRPDTAHLAVPVDAARATLDQCIDAWEEADDDTVASTGAVAYADDQEDTAVADVARRAKVIVAGKLTSPTYVRLFADAPSRLTKGVADDAQGTLVRHLITTIDDNDDYRLLRPAARHLDVAHQELTRVVAERAQRDEVAANAWTELQIAEEAARAAYRDTGPKLELLFPGRKRLVDSFFVRKTAKKKAAAEVAAPTPDPTSA